ncbi:activating signal cointegrator 1 complex subunit 2 homolog [Procambarus clarkii]|uniref:activating signal cointegrator 1 complex subunit 2 homolog n=1 Tax=Procambarus clarkii TaxID=6728 RepID=UPI003742D64C
MHLSIMSLPGHGQHQDPHHPWQRKPPPPHCGESPGGERTEGTSETLAPAPVDTWTSANTNCEDSDVSRTTPSTPKDPQSLNSPTSAQAEDECREPLGTCRTSSLPEADPETQEPPARRTDARRRTATASTTGGEPDHTQQEAPQPPQHRAQAGPEVRMQGQAQQPKTSEQTAMPHREHQEGPWEQQGQ